MHAALQVLAWSLAALGLHALGLAAPLAAVLGATGWFSAYMLAPSFDGSAPHYDNDNMPTA